MAAEKPSKDVFIKYAIPIVHKFINQYASEIPAEHKEEIAQDAFLRLLEQYDLVDAEKGWKSYVYNHCRGTVLDYLKAGKGFRETAWSIAKDEEHDARNVLKIRERLSVSSDSPDDFDLEHALGKSGIFSEITTSEIEINWELVSRMACHDEAIHATAKWLKGFSIEEISKVLSFSEHKVSNLIKGFWDRFDDPAKCLDIWFLQTAFAFGLCGHLGIAEIDQSDVLGFPVGWNWPIINLDSEDVFDLDNELQLSFPDVG